MKKTLIVLIIMLVLVSASSFALGVGLATGLNNGGLPSNLMVSVKLDQLPFLLGIAADFDPFFLGATADWWAFNENLTGPLNLYAGPGIYTAIQGGDGGSVSFGVRAPIGLNVFLLNFFEVFIEVAPSLGFLPDFSIPGSLGIQAAAGFRLWF